MLVGLAGGIVLSTGRAGRDGPGNAESGFVCRWDKDVDVEYIEGDPPEERVDDLNACTIGGRRIGTAPTPAALAEGKS